jgi:hypothetical protein
MTQVSKTDGLLPVFYVTAPVARWRLRDECVTFGAMPLRVSVNPAVPETTL